MGQKQAAIDADGNVVAFYDTVDSPAPDDISTVDITDAQWTKMLAAQATGSRLVIDGSGKLSLLPPLPPTPEQIVAQNVTRRAELLDQASVALAPLQMAVSLGDATDDEREAARQWVTFTRAVKAVDLTVSNPVWPSKPEIAGSN